MTEPDAIVFVVDDDPSVRRSTERLLRSAGLKVQTFSSAREFLHHQPEGPSCLVLDVRMPGLSGMDLQRELAQSGINIPIIFITAHGDIPTTVRAMKAGAVEFLTKPFRGRSLMDAVHAALERDRSAHKVRSENRELRDRYEQLKQLEIELILTDGTIYPLKGKIYAADRQIGQPGDPPERIPPLLRVRRRIPHTSSRDSDACAAAGPRCTGGATAAGC